MGRCGTIFKGVLVVPLVLFFFTFFHCSGPARRLQLHHRRQCSRSLCRSLWRSRCQYSRKRNRHSGQCMRCCEDNSCNSPTPSHPVWIMYYFVWSVAVAPATPLTATGDSARCGHMAVWAGARGRRVVGKGQKKGCLLSVVFPFSFWIVYWRYELKMLCSLLP